MYFTVQPVFKVLVVIHLQNVLKQTSHLQLKPACYVFIDQVLLHIVLLMNYICTHTEIHMFWVCVALSKISTKCFATKLPFSAYILT